MRLLSLTAAIVLALPALAPVEARRADAPSASKASHDEQRVWIVSFIEPPAPLFRGSRGEDAVLSKLAPVSVAVTGQTQYDPERPEAKAYLGVLADRRDARLEAAESRLGRDLEPLAVFEHALNGVALSLTEREAEMLRTIPGVRAVTPDFERFAQTERGPLWIKAPDVWGGAAGVTSRGEGRVVAVIDSGVNASHPSFAATAGGYTHVNPRPGFLGWCASNPGTCNSKLIGVYDFVADSTNGTSANGADPDGHGTHVASTAVGNPVNTTYQGVPLEITGVAPRANLVVYRGCGSTPGNRTCGSSVPLLASINRAVADGVNVINYSIGGGPVDPWLSLGGTINTDEEAFLAAREAGIVVVAAAGNDGPDAGTLGSPANAPWVVGVAAVSHDRNDAGDRLASFSSRGPVTPLGVVKPDVAAPGVFIRAASNTGNGVLQLSGTSMASPHVAGAAALIGAARPTWSADQIISALTLTARAGTVLTNSGGATTPHDRGAGTVDLSKAVNASLGFSVPAGAFRAASESTASTLNLPSLGTGNCVETCTFSRTVSVMPGQTGGTYQITASLPAGLTMTASPSSFTVNAGGSQTINFTFTVGAQASLNTWAYGSVTLRRSTAGTPDLVLPVAIFQSAGVVPALQERDVASERGYIDFNLGNIVSLANARFSSSELAVPTRREQALPEDPTNTDPYDNLSSGVFFETVTINHSDNVTRTYEVSSTLVPSSTPPAQDFDLFVGVDTDADGQPELSEERCKSVSSGAREACTITVTHTGNNVPIRVWALAQNWRASSTGASNTALLEMAAISTAASTRQKATGPGNLPANTDFTARLIYDDPTFLNGQSRFGFLIVDRGPGVNAIRVPFKLTRTSATPAPFAMGLGEDRSVVLPANAAHEYLYIDVPAGATQLTVTTQSSQNVDLYLARVAPLAARPETPTIDAAPARGSAVASATTASGNETVTVNNPQPGRWYLTPVNATASTATATVRASLTGAAPSIRPGGYFNPQRSGHGFFIYPSGPVLVGLWYTYLQDGTPTWYYLQANAPASNGFWKSGLFRSAWNGSSNILVEVGSATLSPTGTDAFTFSYNIDGETGSEAFSSFGGGCPNLGGGSLNVSAQWYNAGRAGNGYSVQLFPNYEFYALFVHDAEGRPRFLTAERASFGGSNASMDLLQNNGFCPLCTRTGDPTRTAIGSFSRAYSGGSFSNITYSGTLINGVTGTVSANETVQALGSLQGCGP